MNRSPEAEQRFGDLALVLYRASAFAHHVVTSDVVASAQGALARPTSNVYALGAHSGDRLEAVRPQLEIDRNSSKAYVSTLLFPSQGRLGGDRQAGPAPGVLTGWPLIHQGLAPLGPAVPCHIPAICLADS